MSDSAPAFDEFLIRSEHQIAARGTDKFKNHSGHSGKPVRVGSAEKHKPRLKHSARKEHTYVNLASIGDALPQFPRTPDRLLNSREVAAWLGVSLDWVQAHATRRNPRIPAVLLGAGRHGRQMLRFRREDVEKFMLDHMGEPSSLRRRA